MKVYLAGRFSRRAEFQGYAGELRRVGHEVTSRWLTTDHRAPEELGGPTAALEQIVSWVADHIAQEDFDDLQSADLLVAFTEPPRSTNSRGGRHVELGLALAWGKFVIVVGPRENAFYCLPQIMVVPTWKEAKDVLWGLSLASTALVRAGYPFS